MCLSCVILSQVLVSFLNTVVYRNYEICEKLSKMACFLSQVVCFSFFSPKYFKSLSVVLPRKNMSTRRRLNTGVLDHSDRLIQAH